MSANVSPKMSLSGWNWKKWLAGNKEALKILVPLVVSYAVTGGVIEAGIGAIIGKAVLDIVDFYTSVVKL